MTSSRHDFHIYIFSLHVLYVFKGKKWTWNQRWSSEETRDDITLKSFGCSTTKWNEKVKSAFIYEEWFCALLSLLVMLAISSFYLQRLSANIGEQALQPDFFVSYDYMCEVRSIDLKLDHKLQHFSSTFFDSWLFIRLYGDYIANSHI